MREDFASVASFIMSVVGEKYNATAYYENVKAGFRVPAIYFPLPEELTSKSTLGELYSNDVTVFVQIFAMTNDSAAVIAEDIKTAIIKTKRYIPIIEEDCSETGRYITVNVTKISRIEDSVVQIQLDWVYNQCFAENNCEKVNNITVGCFERG